MPPYHSRHHQPPGFANASYILLLRALLHRRARAVLEVSSRSVVGRSAGGKYCADGQHPRGNGEVRVPQHVFEPPASRCAVPRSQLAGPRSLIAALPSCFLDLACHHNRCLLHFSREAGDQRSATPSIAQHPPTSDLMAAAWARCTRGLAPATDEEWDRRIAKRTAQVEWDKQVNWRYRRLIAAGTDRPPTPDPTDRTVSKRSWDTALVHWRQGLRAASGQPSDSSLPTSVRPS